MTPEAYVAEIERLFRAGEHRRALALYRQQWTPELGDALSDEQLRRLRQTTHLLLRMADQLGWDERPDERRSEPASSVVQTP